MATATPMVSLQEFNGNTTGDNSLHAMNAINVQSTDPHPEVCPVPIKLFVGRVPPTMDDADIKSIFEEVGPVLECQIIRNKETGEHKNSAFVKMSSLTDADKAVRDFHNIRKLPAAGGTMQVRYAIGEAERLGLTADCAAPGQDEATAFVGSIPRQTESDEVKSIFDPFGVINTVFILKDAGTGESKGCGFVKFAYKEQALQAMQALNQKYTISGASRPLDVRFAVGKNKDNAARQSQTPATTVKSHGGAAANAGQPPAAALFSTPVPSFPPNIGQGPSSYSSNVGYIWPVSQAAPAPQVSNSNPRSAGGWKEYATPDGQVYYHNDSTNVTTWQRPMEFDVIAAPQQIAYTQNPMSYGAIGSIQPQAASPVPIQPPAGQAFTGTAQTSLTERSGPPGANLFLFHIPNNWQQEDIITHFSSFGRIVNARVPVDLKSGTMSNKGFAFLSYDAVSSAVNAIGQMNGFMVGGKRLKVAVKKGEEEHVNHLLKSATSSQCGL